jgi:hypothetical protein
MAFDAVGSFGSRFAASRHRAGQQPHCFCALCATWCCLLQVAEPCRRLLPKWQPTGTAQPHKQGRSASLPAPLATWPAPRPPPSCVVPTSSGTPQPCRASANPPQQHVSGWLSPIIDALVLPSPVHANPLMAVTACMILLGPSSILCIYSIHVCRQYAKACII